VDFLKQRYEGIDWSQLNVKLSEAEVAADKAEKEALVRTSLWFLLSLFTPSLLSSFSLSNASCLFSLLSPQLKEGSTLVAAAEMIIEDTKHKMHLTTTNHTNPPSLPPSLPPSR